MEDFSVIIDFVKNAIGTIAKSGVIEKIPGYVQKLFDIISTYLPKIIDTISGIIAK